MKKCPDKIESVCNDANCPTTGSPEARVGCWPKEMSRFVDSARATVLALTSPGSEWAVAPLPSPSPPHVAPPPVLHALEESSQSTDRSYRSLISSALGVINELRERGFASETYQSSRSSAGGASDASWRDEHLQSSAAATPFSREGSIELPSSSKKIPAFAAVTSTSPYSPSHSRAQRFTHAGVTGDEMREPRTAERPLHLEDQGAFHRNDVLSSRSPRTSAHDARDADLSSEASLPRASTASTFRFTGLAGTARRLPPASPPFTYSPEGDATARTGNQAATSHRLPSTSLTPRLLIHGSDSTSAVEARPASDSRLDSHLVPPSLQSPVQPQMGERTPPLRPDPAAMLIEDAVNEWLDGVAPSSAPVHGRSRLGFVDVEGASPPPPPSVNVASPQFPVPAGTSARSASSDLGVPAQASRLDFPSSGDVAMAQPEATFSQRDDQAGVIIRGGLPKHIDRRGVPQVPSSAADLRRLQRSVESAYHALVRARRAREALVEGRPVSAGAAHSSTVDPRWLPLSRPGATKGGRFLREPVKTLSSQGSSSNRQGAEAAFEALCAELGIEPAASDTPERLINSFRALSHVAATADTLDRFAECVCDALGRRLLPGSSSGAVHIGLEQALVLLDTMVSELEGLRRLKKVGGR